MNSLDAKQFLVSRIADQAQLEDIPFSEIERKMLFFSEAHASLPDMENVTAEFDQTYNMFDYEQKVSSLLCNVYKRDRRDSLLAQQWRDAIRTLRWQDHYIKIMLKRGLASANRKRDFLIYIAIGGIVVLILLATVAFLNH
jgi:hypothetical protein